MSKYSKEKYEGVFSAGIIAGKDEPTAWQKSALENGKTIQNEKYWEWRDKKSKSIEEEKDGAEQK